MRKREEEEVGWPGERKAGGRTRGWYTMRGMMERVRGQQERKISEGRIKGKGREKNGDDEEKIDFFCTR